MQNCYNHLHFFTCLERERHFLGWKDSNVKRTGGGEGGGVLAVPFQRLPTPFWCLLDHGESGVKRSRVRAFAVPRILCPGFCAEKDDTR